MSPAPVQVGLVSAGPLRDGFRRFLELAAQSDPSVVVRELPFRIVIEHAGEPLLRCRPRETAVQCGFAGGEELVCRSPEEFATALQRLLELLRRRLADGSRSTASGAGTGLSASAAMDGRPGARA